MKAPHRRSKFLSLAAHGVAQKRAVQDENIPEATTGEMPEDAVCAEMERVGDRPRATRILQGFPRFQPFE